jgi:hypothetical protein
MTFGLCERQNRYIVTCAVQKTVHCNCEVCADVLATGDASNANMAMRNRYKIALSLAPVLGGASAAFAAHKHPLHAQDRVGHARSASAGTGAYGFVRSSPPGETLYRGPR